MFSEVIGIGYCFLFIFCILFLDILWKFMIRMSYKSKKTSKNKLNYNLIQKIFFQDIKYNISKSIYILNYILTFLFLTILIILIINMIIQNIITSNIASALGIAYLICLFLESIFIGINHKSY